MEGIEIKVNSGAAIAAVRRFAMSLENRQRLLVDLGMAMLVSIRRTFREQGSPANSWRPLSPNTIKKDPKRYGAGHKLLIGTGRLLNSITVRTLGNSGVAIGTNLVYAPVHQYGSRDRGAGEGPQARIDGRSMSVKQSTFYRLKNSLGKGKVKVRSGAGSRSVTMNRVGPRNAALVTRSAHQRFQNIPARPYIVFRPEDPGRLSEVATAFVARAKRAAELEGNDGK